MKNFFEYKKKLSPQHYSVGKTNFTKKLSELNILNTPILRRKNKIKLNNLRKKNLTFVNLNDYTYQLNNLSFRKVKNPVTKIKQELFNHSEYSSFFSNNSMIKKPEFLITELNSVKKKEIENDYKKMFFEEKSKNHDIIVKNFSDNKTKSSSKTPNSKMIYLNTSSKVNSNENSINNIYNKIILSPDDNSDVSLFANFDNGHDIFA